MEGYLLTVLTGDGPLAARVEGAQSLLAALRGLGVYLPAPCGGNGTCGKCRVRLVRGSLAPSPRDSALFTEEELAAGWRLACTAVPGADVTIELPQSGEESISVVTGQYAGGMARPALRFETRAIEKTPASLADDLSGGRAETLSPRLLAQCSALAQADAAEAAVALDGDAPVYIGAGAVPLYGIAVDIGTTTLGFALVELLGGEVVGRHSAVNRQREYGADVISRIVRAGEGALPAMRDSIRSQLGDGVAHLCKTHGVPAEQLVKMTIAGNTTMLHLLLGLSCAGLGVFPFKPVTLAPVRLPYGALFAGGYTCEVYILPGISTYVGADITAGILFTGLHTAEKPALLLDIGTNGEMALACGGKLLCTSTAAGPAFEGGNIEYGTGSVPGAISAVLRDGDGFAVHTIDDKPPVGICGSGVIDAAGVLLAAGLVDETGAFEDGDDVTLARAADGRDIRFTQKDIREVQLGKSAIRSGLDILLARAGLAYGDVGALYLAGGFGYRVNLDSAVTIGLLPAELIPRTVAVGNASLGGAIAALLDGAQATALAEIAHGAEEFGLSEDKAFNDLFVENMMFE